MRWPKNYGLRAALASVSFALLIILAILAGSIIPTNRHSVQPQSGVTIYVYSNGVHTGLVLPAANPLHDWRPRVRSDDLSDPRRAGTWLLFGWGQRDFYLNTPHWSDVKLSTVFPAMISSDRTLMHVDHLQRVWTGPDLRPIVLTPSQYRALTHAIETDFARGAAIKGYGADDVFYPAHGRYSAIVTCNEWTGAKLRAVGVRIGIWTPAAWSVMRWFPASAIQKHG